MIFLLPLHFVSEILRTSPTGSVILIHGSELCMREDRPTKAARPNEATCDRPALLLLLLILLLLPLLPALPLLRLCHCLYRNRLRTKGTRNVVLAEGGVLYTFLFPSLNACKL